MEIKEGISKFVINPIGFRGWMVTSMSNGIHNDYYEGETLEMLRIRCRAPWLIAVTWEEFCTMTDKYHASLQGPFEEITEDQYWDWLGCVPPKRHRNGSFFVGECYSGSLYRFCFELDGKYYSALRDIKLTDEELCKQRRQFSRILKRTEGHIRKRPGGRKRLPRKEKKQNFKNLLKNSKEYYAFGELVPIEFINELLADGVVEKEITTEYLEALLEYERRDQ